MDGFDWVDFTQLLNECIYAYRNRSMLDKILRDFRFVGRQFSVRIDVHSGQGLIHVTSFEEKSFIRVVYTGSNC